MSRNNIEETRIEARGLTSHTLLCGKQTNPAVILLHGAGQVPTRPPTGIT